MFFNQSCGYTSRRKGLWALDDLLWPNDISPPVKSSHLPRQQRMNRAVGTHRELRSQHSEGAGRGSSLSVNGRCHVVGHTQVQRSASFCQCRETRPLAEQQVAQPAAAIMDHVTVLSAPLLTRALAPSRGLLVESMKGRKKRRGAAPEARCVTPVAPPSLEHGRRRGGVKPVCSRNYSDIVPSVGALGAGHVAQQRCLD